MEIWEVLIVSLSGTSMILTIVLCLWNRRQVHQLKKEMVQIKEMIVSQQKNMDGLIQESCKKAECRENEIKLPEEQTVIEKEALINEVLSEVFG